MKHFVCLVFVTLMCSGAMVCLGQQYNGTTGFLHIPSAEMGHEGDARLGAHFLHRAMTPDTGFLFFGEKYNTYDYYMSVTPYRWLELSLTNTKRKDVRPILGDTAFTRKDRYISIKIQPLSERRYVPAIAIGCNDVATTVFKKENTGSQLYFQNYYLAATKHFSLWGNQVGVNVAYRHYLRGYNAKWNGLVGGVSLRPAFFPQARAIVEYTGNELLLGADALLWQHLLVQFSVKDFRYFNFGLCLQLNMLGKQYTY